MNPQRGRWRLYGRDGGMEMKKEEEREDNEIKSMKDSKERIDGN